MTIHDNTHQTYVQAEPKRSQKCYKSSPKSAIASALASANASSGDFVERIYLKVHSGATMNASTCCRTAKSGSNSWSVGV